MPVARLLRSASLAARAILAVRSITVLLCVEAVVRLLEKYRGPVGGDGHLLLLAIGIGVAGATALALGYTASKAPSSSRGVLLGWLVLASSSAHLLTYIYEWEREESLHRLAGLDYVRWWWILLVCPLAVLPELYVATVIAKNDPHASSDSERADVRLQQMVRAGMVIMAAGFAVLVIVRRF